MREEVRWGKEKEERTTRTNEKLQADLQEVFIIMIILVVTIDTYFSHHH